MFPFFCSFPLEREEVQTLRCVISSRTRALDGISLNLILGVSRGNEKHPRHTHHRFPLHLLFWPDFALHRDYGLLLTRNGGDRRKPEFCADAHRSVAGLTARTKRTRERIEKNAILGSFRRDFNNVVLQNQQLIMAATEAAKSAAHTVNQLSENLKAVLTSHCELQGERAYPDPTPVGRPPPPAPPPSTTPSQPGEQREPVRTDQMSEKLSKIMERTAQNFCKQLRHVHRAKGRLEQATETVKFLKENPSRHPSRCRPFSSCVTWSELD